MNTGMFLLLSTSQPHVRQRQLYPERGTGNDYLLSNDLDFTSSRSASTFATTAAVAVTASRVTIPKASPMSLNPSVSAISIPRHDN
jgi:hypothetical protein